MRAERRCYDHPQLTISRCDRISRLHYAADPVLLLVAFSVAIAVATAIAFFFRRTDGKLSGDAADAGKTASLQGSRGVLAFSVVMHHACCWYFYSATGVWTTGNHIIFERLARFGVMQFFYISGFLFWRKLMRKGSIPLGRFYWSRFLRIGPVYYVCVLGAVLIGLFVTGFGMHVTPWVLLRGVVPWLLFCIGGRSSINGADTNRITSGVAWTLALEWGFYLLLPFLAWFARKRSRLAYYVLAFAAVFVLAKYSPSGFLHGYHLIGVSLAVRELSKSMLIGFGGGILIATIEKELMRWNRLSSAQASWLLLLLYATYLMVPGIGTAGEILLLAAFALIVQGTDLFGVITSRGVTLLGIISYDMYLMHGMVFYVAMRMRGGMHPVSLSVYLPETLLCIVAIILLSALLHFPVEVPTMRWSERIARGKSASGPR